MRSLHIALVALLLSAVFVPQALAADLFELDMCFEIPDCGDTHVKVEVFKDKDPDPSDLKGVSECDFVAGAIQNLSCDAVACITSITVARRHGGLRRYGRLQK
jgi:hypothetical protein